MSVEGGRLFAVPYNPFIGDPEKNTLILDHLSEHAGWFSTPRTAPTSRTSSTGC